ncbi:MAG: alcohol dehydrogenase catalytic domain-containing protein [Kiritimatiellales bacterium]
MKALVKIAKGIGNIELREVDAPRPQDNEVLIKIEACGICGTDIHVKHDNFPYWPPVILGHEFTGTVVETGKDCRVFKTGDRVVAEPHTKACGHCYLCRTGNIQICPDKRSPGWGIDGGMTEYICYPEKLLHRIPEHMTWDQAVMIEPVANVVTDLLERTRVDAGDLVVVQGPGAIGLLAAMVAQAVCARDVVILGTPADAGTRFKKAAELGFKHLVNIAETDPVDYVMQLSGGKGADIVVECSGAPRAIPLIPDLLRKQGRVCVIGLTGGRQVELAWDKFAFKALTVVFNMSTFYTSWDKSIDLVASGRVRAEELITHKVKLADWEGAFAAVENLEAIKAVLTP